MIIPSIDERSTRSCCSYDTKSKSIIQCAFVRQSNGCIEDCPCIPNPSRWKDWNEYSWEVDNDEHQLSPCKYHIYEFELITLIDNEII